MAATVLPLHCERPFGRDTALLDTLPNGFGHWAVQLGVRVEPPPLHSRPEICMRHRSFRVLLMVVCGAVSAGAQRNRLYQFLDTCRERYDSTRACETLDFTLPPEKALSVDGRVNGGITVHGWDKKEIQVIAMIDAQARGVASQVTIETTGGRIRADGPQLADRGRHHELWTVSFEVWAPRHTELALSTNNGSILVDGMDSRMNLESVNGGFNLTDVDGDVRGSTVNGRVTAALAGNRWQGAGLDLSTSNGGVRLYVPASYSARLESGTVNGGMEVGFPITVAGLVGRKVSMQLGSGGATIRAITKNGGVSIQRR